MEIKQIESSAVFDALQTAQRVIAVDFKRGEYIDLSGQTFFVTMRLISNSDVRFFTVAEVYNG